MTLRMYILLFLSDKVLFSINTLSKDIYSIYQEIVRNEKANIMLADNECTEEALSKFDDAYKLTNHSLKQLFICQKALVYIDEEIKPDIEGKRERIVYSNDCLPEWYSIWRDRYNAFKKDAVNESVKSVHIFKLTR